MQSLRIRNDGDEVEVQGQGVSVVIRFTPVGNPKPAAPEKGKVPTASKRLPIKTLTPVARGTKGLEPPAIKPGEPRPLAAPPLGWTKQTRPGTKRAKVVNMLRAGTTIDRIMKTMSWSRNDAREAVRQIHREMGFGIEERGAKLTLIEAEPAEVVPR